MAVRMPTLSALLAACLCLVLAPASALAQLAGLSADGDRLLIIGEQDQRVRVLDDVKLKIAVSGRIVAIDLRAADGGLYGLSETGAIYRIDVGTGKLSRRFDLGATLSGAVSMDCEAAEDSCRLLSDAGESARFTFKDRVLELDRSLAYPRAEDAPQAVAAAFLNSHPASKRAVLLVIDAAKDKLFALDRPKTGRLVPVGDVRPRIEGSVAFDVATYAPGDNVAVMVNGDKLYRLDFADRVFRKVARIEGLDVRLRDVAFLFAAR